MQQRHIRSVHREQLLGRARGGGGTLPFQPGDFLLLPGDQNRARGFGALSGRGRRHPGAGQRR